ncbi:hypothetical protein LTR92_011170 [Exophiala xenobiotica]|nr:hypothetical protein LTR92_011170 [Exophiala xenobiotica]KAK5284232.1 hypothetical protein LTR14_011728 [Exophiala xenobiotica]KAK5311460.1 hypothetical protein LTR93_011714 [Exophiala xenobiotica]
MESHHPNEGPRDKQLNEYEVAWKTGSVENFMSFMSEDVSFSDFGVGVLDLDKAAMGAYFAKVFGSIDNLKITTISVNDQKTFTAWEWEVTFNYVKPIEEVAQEEVFSHEMADGRTMHMFGVSLLWWNDKGKIVKKHDYSKTVVK